MDLDFNPNGVINPGGVQDNRYIDQSNQSTKFPLIDNTRVEQWQKTQSGIHVVWLEKKSDAKCEDSRIELPNFNNQCSAVYYSNISKCMKYLKRARSRDYIIIIIIAYPIETIQRLIRLLRQHRLVQAIFVVCSDNDTTHYLPPITDHFQVFSSQQSMFNFLVKRIEQVKEQYWNDGLFTTFHRNEKAMKDVQEDLATFVWTHVYKVLFMAMPQDPAQARREMLNECRAYYRNDKTQLDHINTFERQYQSKDIIRWYTKAGFLFFLVNKALRTEDIWMLYTFRCVIVDLCSRLKEISRSQCDSPIRLYRGAKLNRAELDKLQVGCIVSTNGFLSCSRKRNVSEMFMDAYNISQKPSDRNGDASYPSVLFIIDVDRRTSPSTILADISHESMFPDEEEVVFSFGSTFLIKEIEFDTEKCVWSIQMSATGDKNALIDQYETYILERLQYTDPTILFGHALANISSDFGLSLTYFLRLLRILPLDHLERPNVYYNLGSIYYFMEKLDNARHCFQCARLLVRRLLPERMFDYCRILGGLGLVYSALRDTQRAIHWLQQALTLHKKSFPDNHTELPFHLGRLGDAYYQAKDYHGALAALCEAKLFFERKMPASHQGYGHTLHRIGLVYRALGDDLLALTAFENAMQKQCSLLGKDHPRLASTYYQLSLLHNDRADYELARHYIEKALQIQLIKLPSSHSELKLSKELLRRLPQHS